LRQVWLPNPTHVTMLHFLAYAYQSTTFGDKVRYLLLQNLGRAANWLFREAERPGQVVVMDSTTVLRESFTFPADDVRQAHLGFLLAWLRTAGKRDARIHAAMEAEQLSVATALDPELERDHLEPLVEKWNKARKADDKSLMRLLDKAIREILEPELRRRIQLAQDTIDLMEKDGRRVNAGTETLAETSQSEHWYQYLRLELAIEDPEDGEPFIPHPETDHHPSAAAARYRMSETFDELRHAVLVRDDDEMLDETIAEGDAFRGVVRSVIEEQAGRARTPVWKVETDSAGPLRLRKGSSVELLTDGIGRKANIRNVTDSGKGHRLIELEFGLRKKGAEDPKYKGRKVVFIAGSDPFLSRKRSQAVWKSDGPGCWLTHSKGVFQPIEEADEP